MQMKTSALISFNIQTIIPPIFTALHDYLSLKENSTKISIYANLYIILHHMLFGSQSDVPLCFPWKLDLTCRCFHKKP